MGSHGLSWRAGSTEVERVSCQARLLGVKPGWSISTSAELRRVGWLSGTIDGVQIETSYQAWNELMRCKKSGKKYQALRAFSGATEWRQVYFMKDEASIREDQAKAEAEKARKAKQEPARALFCSEMSECRRRRGRSARRLNGRYGRRLRRSARTRSRPRSRATGIGSRRQRARSPRPERRSQ